MTRRHHGTPPQPKLWFRNLIDCFGESLQIRVARKQKQPVAAILTLRHGDTLVYKYGGSDPGFNNLGGTHLLFWQSILNAKRLGLHTFDLGRSEFENPNLITFKDRWGAARSLLTYSRFAPRRSANQFRSSYSLAAMRSVFRRLPTPLFRLIGKMLYKHIG